MNSVNNEVCEFDPTPTTENFASDCIYDDNCSSNLLHILKESL